MPLKLQLLTVHAARREKVAHTRSPSYPVASSRLSLACAAAAACIVDPPPLICLGVRVGVGVLLFAEPIILSERIQQP
ncbi:hypothetical protein ACS0TY_021795 [Phlomoides rotata]